MPTATRSVSPGLHHVGAIATRPQGNVDFYVRVLGLRLVKRTVNFDDPQTYNLYFGDAAGNPGTVLSFYAWPGVGPGHLGTGEASQVTLAVPPGTLDGWRARLEHHFVTVEAARRFGERLLSFRDPDGLPLALTEREGATAEHWHAGDVPPEMSIRGLGGVTLRVAQAELAATFLETALGLRRVASEPADATPADGSNPPTLLRLEAGACRVDLLETGQQASGRLGAGSVREVAFRAPSEVSEEGVLEALTAAGATGVKTRDQYYYRATTFRTPEDTPLVLATDGPGFTLDEPLDELGLALRLPTWLEEDRPFLRGRLPVIASPEYADRWGKV